MRGGSDFYFFFNFAGKLLGTSPHFANIFSKENFAGKFAGTSLYITTDGTSISALIMAIDARGIK